MDPKEPPYELPHFRETDVPILWSTLHTVPGYEIVQTIGLVSADVDIYSRDQVVFELEEGGLWPVPDGLEIAVLGILPAAPRRWYGEIKEAYERAYPMGSDDPPRPFRRYLYAPHDRDQIGTLVLMRKTSRADRPEIDNK